MRILSRYLLASFLRLFASILLGSMLSIAVIEALVNVESLFEGVSSALTYLLLRVPAAYVRDLIPIAAFAAAFFCIGLPARRAEVTAMRAGGISPQRAALPLLVTAGIFSGIALVVNETVVLRAARTSSRLDAGDESIAFRGGSFWYYRGNSIYNVDDVDRDSQTLHGVRVFEMGPRGRLLRSIRADRVQISEGRHWHFRGAVVRRFDPSDPATSPVVERVDETILDVGEERDLALLSSTASTLSLGNLREYIAARHREGRTTLRYRALLHARLSQPLTVLLFALLAVPIGLSVERTRSLAVSALQGFLLLGLFFVLRGAGAMFAAGGVAAAVPASWLLLSAFGGYGTWRFARMPR